MKPIERACELLGGQQQLADAIGVTPAFVNQLVKGLRPIPPDKCVAVELATNGEVSRCELYSGSPEKLWPELCDVKRAVHDDLPN